MRTKICSLCEKTAMTVVKVLNGVEYYKCPKCDYNPDTGPQ